MGHWSKGNYEIALKNLKYAVLIAPNFSTALYEMARCYERLGQYPEALSVVNEVLQINQTHIEAEMSRKRILDKMGRTR
jgi:tetratricopeptide (TPR) repeat protein